MKVSVIICTHNPKSEFLQKTLDSLQAQTLPLPDWELIVVDNASEEPVNSRFSVLWHPHGLMTLEGELGLTPARLHGISVASGELMVFVDDDNILSPSYLSEVVRIGDSYPELGAWGGQQIGAFEVDPPQYLRPHLGMLALRTVSDEKITGEYNSFLTPSGAGMILRASVAREYVKRYGNSPVRSYLGRKGESLASGEDVDMCWTTIDMGMKIGLFPELSLQHIIPSGRLHEDYLVRIKGGITYSGAIVKYLHGVYVPPKQVSEVRKRVSDWYRRTFLRSFEYRLFVSERAARYRADQVLKELSEVKESQH
jgi:glycosyltransferase involved in cell wall biosynthesis